MDIPIYISMIDLQSSPDVRVLRGDNCRVHVGVARHCALLKLWVKGTGFVRCLRQDCVLHFIESK
jgi:hypothetical protein